MMVRKRQQQQQQRLQPPPPPACLLEVAWGRPTPSRQLRQLPKPPHLLPRLRGRHHQSLQAAEGAVTLTRQLRQSRPLPLRWGLARRPAVPWTLLLTGPRRPPYCCRRPRWCVPAVLQQAAGSPPRPAVLQHERSCSQRCLAAWPPAWGTQQREAGHQHHIVGSVMHMCVEMAQGVRNSQRGCHTVKQVGRG
jgi:hypothetical protein